MIIKCMVCGNTYRPGNNKDGVPKGVGLKLKNGKTFNVCSDCIAHRTEKAVQMAKQAAGYEA